MWQSAVELGVQAWLTDLVRDTCGKGAAEQGIHCWLEGSVAETRVAKVLLRLFFFFSILSWKFSSVTRVARFS